MPVHALLTAAYAALLAAATTHTATAMPRTTPDLVTTGQFFSASQAEVCSSDTKQGQTLTGTVTNNW